MNIVETFKPDVYVTLCDGDTNVNSRQKRITKSLETSKKLFTKCYQKHKESNVLRNKGFLGAVEGGYNLKAREESIKYMEGKELLGYVIDGLHTNGIETEQITTDQIESVVKHSLVRKKKKNIIFPLIIFFSLTFVLKFFLEIVTCK